MNFFSNIGNAISNAVQGVRNYIGRTFNSPQTYSRFGQGRGTGGMMDYATPQAAAQGKAQGNYIPPPNQYGSPTFKNPSVPTYSRFGSGRGNYGSFDYATPEAAARGKAAGNYTPPPKLGLGAGIGAGMFGTPNFGVKVGNLGAGMFGMPQLSLGSSGSKPQTPPASPAQAENIPPGTPNPTPNTPIESKFGESQGTNGMMDNAFPVSNQQTNQQNQQTISGNKFDIAHQSLKGKPAPIENSIGGAAAGAAVNEANNQINQSSNVPGAIGGQQLFDNLSGGQDETWNDLMNLQKESDKISSVSLLDTYNQLTKSSGIEALDTKLMDMNKVINGTEQDIRTEVEKAGGFATNSQVMALASARNKTLIQTYNSLLEQKNQIEKHIDMQMGFAKEDRNFALQQINNRMNFDYKILDYKEKAQNNAREAMRTVVSQVGYGGLLAMTGGNPTYTAKAERMLGLAPGGLSQLANYHAPMTEAQQLDIQYKKAQIAKMAQPDTQIVEENGKKFLIDSHTGAIIKSYDNMLSQGKLGNKDTTSQDTIGMIDSLKTHTGLTSAVGPTGVFGRFRLFGYHMGARQDFLAGVDRITSQLTLDKLIQAKAQGATFGALSEGEMRVLQGAATKLNRWAKRDKDGNVVAYHTTEKAFKAELDRVSNLARQDFLNRGGDPQQVGIQKMPDGKLITRNSDGSYNVYN